MSRPIHFEIHAADVARACEFYSTVFGWAFEDWSEYAGMAYMGATTGEEGQPGINGAIMARMPGQEPTGINGAVLTLGSADYDADHERILAAGEPWHSRRAPCRVWPGRGTTSTPRAMSLVCTNPTPRPARTGRPLGYHDGARRTAPPPEAPWMAWRRTTLFPTTLSGQSGLRPTAGHVGSRRGARRAEGLPSRYARSTAQWDLCQSECRR